MPSTLSKIHCNATFPPEKPSQVAGYPAPHLPSQLLARRRSTLLSGLQCWVRHLKIPTIPCIIIIIIIIIIVLPIEIVWYSYTLGTLGYNLTLRTDPTTVLWVLFLSLGRSNWSTFFSCPDRWTVHVSRSNTKTTGICGRPNHKSRFSL